MSFVRKINGALRLLPIPLAILLGGRINTFCTWKDSVDLKGATTKFLRVRVSRL